MNWIKVYKGENQIILDDGLFFGRGVFETIAVYKGPIMLKEHINRINSSLKKLSIDKKIDYREIKNIIKEDKIEDKALKIIVTSKNNIISLRDITYKEKDYRKGFSLGLSEVIRSYKGFLTSIKSICYEENIHIRQEGLEKNFNEMLLMNDKGKITEGTLSNIFFVREEKIYTPKLSCGLLNGIVREWVINNYDVYEGEFTFKDLLLSEEIFITNSLIGVMWINRLEDVKFLKGKITNNVMKRYKTFLEENGGYIND